jgi:hypothetical protein
MDSTGVEEDPLGRFESERFTSAARSMSGKPPEMHRGSVRAESGSGPVSRSHVAESQMRIGNSWVGTLESVVATRKFCIEYRGQGRWRALVQTAGKRHSPLRYEGARRKAQLFRLHSRKRATDFPVMAEGIDYAADAPVVLFGDGIDFLGAGLHSTGENGVGVRYRQDDSDRDAA